jgi:hypothetical protein
MRQQEDRETKKQLEGRNPRYNRRQTSGRRVVDRQSMVIINQKRQ